MFERLDTSAKKYVVLDVETNGLSSRMDDLLSISIYKPDDGLTYNRFLPLELDGNVYTTNINGIRKKDLKGKKPLSQEEVDGLFLRFELSTRTILHYGSIDERFIKAYFIRHKLSGLEKMSFFNYKRLICSSPFSNEIITKDNLCNMYGIDGVQEVHSGLNDCCLEWKLFERIGGQYLLATDNDFSKTNFFALSPDYVVPVSYLRYPNLSRIINRPDIQYQTEEVFRLKIQDKGIKRFPSNFTGMTIEHLINTMLDVERVDSYIFQLENKNKLKYVGSIDNGIRTVFMNFNDDGTVSATKKEDAGIEKELNAVTVRIKKKIGPLIAFIRSSVFKGSKILSQEISIDSKQNVMAICDLSNADSVLEIKTGRINMDYYKEQLYYEAAGRESYIMGMEWFNDGSDIEFYILKVSFTASEKKTAQKRWEERLTLMGIELTNYKGTDIPLGLRCRKCGYEWSATAKAIQRKSFGCPACDPKTMNREITPKKKQRDSSMTSTPEERFKTRVAAYSEKVNSISNGTVLVCSESYTGSKDKVKAHCNICGNEWEIRADHLLKRCYCPVCRKNKAGSCTIQ